MTKMVDLLKRIPFERILRWVGYAFVAYLAWSTALTFRYLWSMLLFPGDIDYGEGIILHEINVLKLGHELYRSSGDLPFLAMNYGPLYYFFAEIVAPLASNSFFPFRLLSFLGLIALAISGWYITFRITGDKIFGILGGCAVLIPPSMYIYGINAKPDSVALAFSLAGMAMALRALEDKKGIVLAGILFACALCYKQTSLPAPLTVGIYLLWKRRDLLKPFLIAGTLAGLVICGVWAIRFGLKGFIEHMLFYNVAEFDKARMLREPMIQAKALSPFLLGALLAHFYIRQPILMLYFLIAFVFHTVTMAKAGSHIQYYSEPMMVLFLIALTGFGQAFARLKTGPWPLRAVQAAIVLGALVFLKLYDVRYQKKPPSIEEAAKDQILMQTITEIIGDKKPIVYSSITGLFPRFGEKVRIIVDDPFLYNQHVLSGKRDDTEFQSMIIEKKIGLIIINYKPKEAHLLPRHITERTNVTQARLIDAHYQLIGEYPGTLFTEKHFYFYTPKPVLSRVSHM